MYVTRPLSQYRASPEAAAAAPPEGPHSGYLVIQDEQHESQATCCFGLCRDPYLDDLPFPQNRLLSVRYTTSNGQNSHTFIDDVLFFPVAGLPLSSNRYYVVRAKGKHAGKVCTCSSEEDKREYCFCSCICDVKPKPFEQENDLYQQVEIGLYRSCSRKGFCARAVAPDGFPPLFLRRKGWKIRTTLPRTLSLSLGAASGVDNALRNRGPDTKFSLPSPRSPAAVVGKWYCPFIFVKEEGCPPREQMKRSVFYEVALEQFWEAIHACECDNAAAETVQSVRVVAGVRREVAMLPGSEPVKEPAVPEEDGFVSFRAAAGGGGGGGVGLSAAVVERMRWEATKGGWEGGKGGEAERVERTEEYREGGWGWRRFGCYVLVERFAVKRLDGTLVLTYDFRRVDNIISKWE